MAWAKVACKGSKQPCAWKTVATNPHDVARVRHLSQSGPGLLLRNKVQELQRILKAPNNPAYHLAKSEWNKLQEDYTRRLSSASEPLTRARLSREFAESGLLEDSMATFYLDQSQQMYQALIDLADSEIQAWLELADLLVVRQRYAQASQLLERASQRFPERANWLLRQLEVSYYACQKLSPPPILDLINIAWDYAQREAVEEPDEAAQYWRAKPLC